MTERERDERDLAILAEYERKGCRKDGLCKMFDVNKRYLARLIEEALAE